MMQLTQFNCNPTTFLSLSHLTMDVTLHNITLHVTTGSTKFKQEMEEKNNTSHKRIKNLKAVLYHQFQPNLYKVQHYGT